MTEGTCTHIRIIQYVYVHVSSIKTCFDVLIYVQGLLYICVSAANPNRVKDRCIIFMFSNKDLRMTRKERSHGVWILGYFDMQSPELNDSITVIVSW